MSEKIQKKEGNQQFNIMSREQTLFFDAVKKGTLNERLLTALLAKNIAIDGIDASCYTATMHCIRRNDLTTFFFFFCCNCCWIMAPTCTSAKVVHYYTLQV